MNMITRIALALLLCIGIVAPAAAQGSCVSPPAMTKSTTFIGHNWSMRNGIAWNSQTPYAACLGDGYARFELRDTPYDHGANDASKKRRAEIGTNVAWQNGVEYWFAYSIKAVAVGGNQTKMGDTQNQFQSTDGSSPAFSNRLQYCSGGPMCLVQTTRLTGGSTIKRGSGVFTLGAWHDVVDRIKFDPAGNGLVQTWLDGKLITNWSGAFGGSSGLRIGAYGQPLGGMVLVWEYKNISPFPSTASLYGRVLSPPPL